MQEKGCLPSSQPCPRSLVMQSWEAETLYRSSRTSCVQIPKEFRVLRRVGSRQRTRKHAPSQAKCSQEQIPLVSMDTLHYAQNVTCWPLSPLVHRREAHAYNSQDRAQAYRRTDTRSARRLPKYVLVLYILIARPLHARLFTRGKQMNQPKSPTRRGWFSISIIGEIIKKNT